MPAVVPPKGGESPNQVQPEEPRNYCNCNFSNRKVDGHICPQESQPQSSKKDSIVRMSRVKENDNDNHDDNDNDKNDNYYNTEY